jgi:hypothetical protein
MTTTPTSSSERAARARHDYSSYQIALHWTVVALVVVNWLLGQRMEDIFEARMEGQAVPSPWLRTCISRSASRSSS